MDNIELFIKQFKKDFGNAVPIEQFFTGGYCYHFSVILNKLFFGEIFYNPVENHFATYTMNDRFEYGLYDITGKIEITQDWAVWEFYKKEDPIEADRIIKQCIYKIYEDE